MKIIGSSGGGGIKSMQVGHFGPSSSGVTIPHNPVNVEKSELRFYGAESGDSVSKQIGIGLANVSRTESSFTHIASSSSLEALKVWSDSGSQVSVNITRIYWELIEYA